MHRHRITAGVAVKQYTIHLIRWLTDEKALELLTRSKGAASSTVKDATEMICYREEFNLAGYTTSREEIGRVKIHD